MGSKMEDKALPIGSDEPEHEPDITKLTDSLEKGSQGIRSFALSGLFILALFYTLYFARIFLLPIMLALLFTFLLRPVVRILTRIRIPEPLGAVLVLLALLGAVGYGVYNVSGPAAEWMAKAPQSLNEIQDKLRALRKPIKKVSEATEQVEKMTNVNEGKKTQVVELKSHSLRDVLFSNTSEVIIGGATMIVLLYFLLASGDLFLLKLVRVLPTLENKKRAIEIAREIQRQISTYLFTVTLVYAGQGLVIALAMFIIGMPNPVLWGVMSGVLEFIPYIGPTVGISVVAAVAVFTFHSIGHAALAPALYFGVTTIQANFILPVILGRRLTLNPVVIFIGFIFWGWMWGVVGFFLAVPILMTFKIFCDDVEPLSAVGEFLGR